MDKFFFVIGYTTSYGRNDGSSHFTEIIFCEDGKPLIMELKAIYRRGRCEDIATSQFLTNELDEYLTKLHPGGRQEKIRINIGSKFRNKVSKELYEKKKQEWLFEQSWLQEEAEYRRDCKQDEYLSCGESDY